MFETQKSGNKTGLEEIVFKFNNRTPGIQRSSALCWHAAPLANVPLETSCNESNSVISDIWCI